LQNTSPDALKLSGAEANVAIPDLIQTETTKGSTFMLEKLSYTPATTAAPSAQKPAPFVPKRFDRDTSTWTTDGLSYLGQTATHFIIRDETTTGTRTTTQEPVTVSYKYADGRSSTQSVADTALTNSSLRLITK